MKARASQSPASRSAPFRRRDALRILTAVPLCDGHDSAIMTVNLELVRHGIQVIYLGYNRSVRDVVRAAVQEDVQAVGLSSYNGGHVEFFTEVRNGLRGAGAGHIGLFGGGGGTITPADVRVMKRRGVDEIFSAGSSLSGMTKWVKESYSGSTSSSFPSSSSWFLQAWGSRTRTRTRTIAHAWGGRLGSRREQASVSNHAGRMVRAELANALAGVPVIGFTGPGGAGKTTLIDELVLRFLRTWPGRRIAILTHDPSMPNGGALLGDRAAMVYAHDDRVFMHSLAASERHGGISGDTKAWLQILKGADFDLVLVESAGIGQQDMPFADGLVNGRVLVLSPEYGGSLQLQKIAMLEGADVVVVNKADRPGARTAIVEVGHRVAMSRKGQKIIPTVANRHGDEGVDELFRELIQ
ncbi:MAG: hypothetical protein C5B50_13895 [Verrucomicrobia bacterium]|nr:MAG: hypothetical protein C5B50_13895 [Verrucomicrobiota bacterium]